MNDTSTRPDAPDTVEKGESLWVGAWYRLRKNKMALAGGVFIHTGRTGNKSWDSARGAGIVMISGERLVKLVRGELDVRKLLHV